MGAMGTFSVFDHTADIGLEVYGADLADLLETAARAAFDQMLEDLPGNVETTEEVRAACAEGLEDEAGELVVAWLQELLYLFETAALVPLEITVVACGPREVRARVGFGRFDANRHRTRTGIKAVTYHGLDVHQEADGSWSARFILDV
jgi:SHS2 domain-containing protein